LGERERGPAVVLCRLRVDRIDELADGSVLVIDYKVAASAKKAKSWEGERPEEPQLPIYAVALTDQGRRVAGVAFANLSGRDDVGFSGLSGDVVASGEIEPKRPRKGGKPDPDWPGIDGQIAQWRDVLSRLAEDYASGNARVDPRNASLDCRYCGRDPLCRKFELDLDADEDDAPALDGAAQDRGEPYE
jgi:RecB family exonuclease